MPLASVDGSPAPDARPDGQPASGPAPVGGWFDSLASWAGQSIDALTGKAQVDARKDANAQNLQLTREQWAREDNAVQRRAADLKAAGINPALAAGSAAAASPAARMESVGAANPIGAMGNFVQGLSGVAKQISDVVQGVQSVANMQTQQKLLEVQTQREQQSVDQASAMNPVLLSSAKADALAKGFQAVSADYKSRGDKNAFFADWSPADIRDMLPDAGVDKKTAAGDVYTSSIAYQQAQARMKSFVEEARRAGVLNEILAATAKLDPGTAEGIQAWVSALSGGILGRAAGAAIARIPY